MGRNGGWSPGAIDDLDLALELEPRNVVALSSRGDAKRMLNDAPAETGRLGKKR